jgi:elongator complex protein 1
MKNLWKTGGECWNMLGYYTCDTDKIYVLVDKTILKVVSKDLIQEYSLEIEIPDVVDITFLQLDEKLVFVTATAIISFNTLTKECINEGEFNCQISSAKWSPNQEYLALYLANGTLITQTAELEIVKAQNIGLEGLGCIAWRTDSKYFQICCSSGNGYKVTTYTATGELVPTPIVSDTNGSVQSVCDNTSLLTSSYITWHFALIAGINNQKIVLWEKNGLKHNEFTVLGTRIDQVHWSIDGKVLSVITNEGIELYVRSNYHWYLKLLIKNGKSLFWTQDFLLVQTDMLLKLELKHNYSIFKDTVAVVDGLNLHLTDFSKGILPPPMSHNTYKLNSPATRIFIGDNSVLAVTDQIYSYPDGEIIYNSSVDNIYSSNSTIYVSIQNKLYKVINKQLDLVHEYQSNIAKIFGKALDTYIQLVDGTVFSNDQKLLKLPGYCEDIGLLEINGKNEVIALHGNNFYIGNKIFCTGCTSMLESSGFLFITKKSAPFDILYIFHHTNFPWTLNLPDPNSDHYYSRNVEKTSSIVCLTGTTLILQHSRGNLEGITPRLVILHKIRTLVTQKNYLEAFKLLRKHKIDLNLICDIEYDNFDVKEFLKQIPKQDFINLFLTSLKDIDSVSKYFHTESRDLQGKSNKISDLIREKLDPLTQPLSILTSFAVKSPPEIENALKWVQDLKKNTQQKPPRPPHETEVIEEKKVYAEDAIKYLSWLVNPEKLYDVALSIYDLELASQLAKYTQKDPKEYLPYLNSLLQSDPIMMKYQINIDLKNYRKALYELSKGGAEYRALSIDLIKNHRLFLQGMDLLKGKDVIEGIAETLVKLNYPLQAASLFEVCRNYSRAKEMYLVCEEWELACKAADMIGENIKDQISARCADLGRFESAALMAGDSSDENLVIKYWFQAGKYKQAVIFAKSDEGRQLLSSTLKNYAFELIDDINKNIKQWKEKHNRLKLVQQNKKLMPESNKVLNDETASQYSMDSSMSKATQFTKKQKKKNQKIRKTAAKEGSQFEEDYLVDLLVTLRPDLSYLEKVESLCNGLILIGDIITAHKLWLKLEEIKKITFVPIYTLKHQEFISKFYETFPEIVKNEENESKLQDMYSNSTFLSDGLVSHRFPSFTSKLTSFFNTLNLS